MGKDNDFYLRFYTGHKGSKFGHEFLEFELHSNGKLRYANHSGYKGENMIRKEVFVNTTVIEEFKKIIDQSQIMKEDDSLWPEPERSSMQELEIVMDKEHISFAAAKVGSLLDVQECKDPESFRAFYYLTLDLKAFVFSLMSLHFKIKPIN